MDLSAFEKKLGYSFRDQKLLLTALTHSSFANESKNKREDCYERLEFLGDSILGAVTADHIFRNTKLPEGELTRLKASLVCEKALCGYSKELGVGAYMRLSRGEERGGGRERASILADMFEAITAAIYLDGGIEAASRFVLRFIIPAMNAPKQKTAFKDYKTLLQEIIQKNPEDIIEYQLESESGPDHNKHFVMRVLLDNNVIGRGGGKSKKEAEQQAAREALELMGY